MLFAAFPTHTEDVCSIKNRDEILSLLLGLLTLFAAYKWVSVGKKVYLALTPVFFVSALLSKTTVVSFVVIIPITLILFTGVRLRQLVLICTLLLLPALFAIDFGLWDKLIGSFLLVLGVALFYVMARSPIERTLIRFKSLITAPFPKNNIEQIDGSAPGFRGLKILLSNINPGAGILTLKSIMLAALAGALFIVGIYTVFPSAEIGAVLILGAFIIWGDEPLWWWANTILYGCLGWGCIWYGWNKTLYGELVSAILAYQIFFGRRKLFIPATFIFILISVIDLRWGEFYILLNRLVGVVGFRIIGWPAVIWQAIPIHNFFKHGDFASQNLLSTVQGIGLGCFFVTALIISLIFRTGTRFLIGSYVLLALSVLIYLQVTIYKPISLVTAQHAVANTVNKVNPKFIEIKQDRPLDFVEQPVTPANSTSIRIGTAFEVLCHYFTKTLVPYPMAFYYGYSFIKPESITDLKPLTGVITYFLLAIFALACIRKNKVVSAGLLIYLASITIFSGYFYPVPGQVAERFMLIPSIGWCILLGFAFFGVFDSTGKTLKIQWQMAPKITRGIFLAVLILYSAITFSRNFDWKDDLTLYRHDIIYVDESVQAHNILATHLVDHSLVITDPVEQTGLREEAIGHFKKAVSIRPSFFNPTYDIGRVYLMLNSPDSAQAWLIKAKNLSPYYTDISLNIADIYIQREQYRASIPYLESAIRLRPEDYTGYNKLSFVYFKLNEPYQSIAVSKQEILKAHAAGTPYVAIGSVYFGLHKADSAALWAHKALEIEPGNQGAIRLLNSLGEN